ncbi:hypothetical protein [Alicyclobacillus sp. SP_1]|nr:hypothetical protein [Alicyclobacillus sp. SP_1]
MKYNAANAGNYGVFNVDITGSWLADGLEYFDGVINDQDFKPAADANI